MATIQLKRGLSQDLITQPSTFNPIVIMQFTASELQAYQKAVDTYNQLNNDEIVQIFKSDGPLNFIIQHKPSDTIQDLYIMVETYLELL